MNEKNLVGGGVLAIFLIVVALVFLFGSIYSVDEGEVGVLFNKWGANAGFDPTEISQGMHFKTPFKTRAITMPFRTQEIAFFGGETKGSYGVIQPKDKNGINFNVDVTVRYRIDPTQASEFIEQKGEGVGAMSQLLATAVRADSTRGVFGQYNQEDVPQNRIEIAKEIKRVLQERLDTEATGKLKPGFITIESIDVRNVQFDQRIETAIVNKQEQKQVAERKTYELQQAEKDREIAIVNADKDKQARILIAEGEAQAIVEVAKAKAEGIEAINNAYQDMPQAYVSVKYAEAIKATDKVYLGFDSLGGSTLPVMNVNQLMGQSYAGGVKIAE